MQISIEGLNDNFGRRNACGVIQIILVSLMQPFLSTFCNAIIIKRSNFALLVINVCVLLLQTNSFAQDRFTKILI
jgi:hypothetical protein